MGGEEARISEHREMGTEINQDDVVEAVIVEKQV